MAHSTAVFVGGSNQTNTLLAQGVRAQVCARARNLLSKLLQGSCNYFKWCDEVTMEEINSSPQFPYPKCDCSAEICQKHTEKSGHNAGRNYFICPIQNVEGLMHLMEGEHVGSFNLGNLGEFTMLKLAQVVQE